MAGIVQALVSGFVLALTFVGSSPAQAAQSSFSVDGAAAKGCGLGATSVGISVVNSNNVITVTFSPTSVTAWCNTAGTLGISSTQLLQTGTTNKFLNYTLRVSGWGSAVTYTTATTPPSPTTQSSSTLSTTLSFSCTAGCTAPPVPKNKSYAGTITLSLSPN